MIIERVNGILASNYEGVIGFRDSIPWSHRGDMRRFVRLTRGHAVLLGVKTFKGMVKHYASPNKDFLPDRFVIVVGEPRENERTLRQELLEFVAAEGKLIDPLKLHCITPSLNPYDDLVNSIVEVDQKFCSGQTAKLFIAGGAAIYSRYLEFASTVYLTLIKREFDSTQTVKLYPHTQSLLFNLNTFGDWDVMHQGVEMDEGLEAKYLKLVRVPYEE